MHGGKESATIRQTRQFQNRTPPAGQGTGNLKTASAARASVKMLKNILSARFSFTNVQ
jgi:hypothetical protein